PERLHQFAGEVRPDAFDHARAQVLLDPFNSTWRCYGDGPRLELPSVGAVLDPSAVAFEVFAGGHLAHRAHDAHQVALPRHFDPQDTEAGLRTLKGDPLDPPC